MDLAVLLLVVAVVVRFNHIRRSVPMEEVLLRLEYELYRLGFIKYKE